MFCRDDHKVNNFPRGSSDCFFILIGAYKSSRNNDRIRKKLTSLRGLSHSIWMKFLCFLLVVGFSFVAWGQENSEKQRIIFPAGSKKPLSTPVPEPLLPLKTATPVPTPTPKTQPTATPKPLPIIVYPAREPEEILNAFFMLLTTGNVANAYDDLVRGTLLADRPDVLNELKKSTVDAIEKFGPVRGFDEISTIKAGERLIRKTCLSYNTDTPLRWRFYFYKADKEWKLIDLRIDDALAQLIDEIATPAQSR